MKAMIQKAELRGHEVRVSKSSNEQYAIVYFEDETGKSNQIICRDINMVSRIQKGCQCNLICKLEIGKYTKFELLDIEEI